jgi:hypothetical protein
VCVAQSRYSTSAFFHHSFLSLLLTLSLLSISLSSHLSRPSLHTSLSIFPSLC